MPELPDVETFRRYLDATSLHKRIEDVKVEDTAVLRKISKGKFKSSLQGRVFESSRRLGKYVFVQLDNSQSLMLHFGMTGYLKYKKRNGSVPEYTRLFFDFENGYTLCYVCSRKLGRVRIVPGIETIVEEKGLGIDAMDPDLDLRRFREIMGKRRGMAKTALMNQSVIAGIGNVYADEILYQAGIHPERDIRDLSGGELKKLFRVMRRVLRVATERKADPGEFPRRYLTRRREEGRKCPGCGGEVRKIKVNSRGTYLCPRCQK